MIRVEEKVDGTQVWTHLLEGDYTFVPLSTLRPGDRLEADHRRPEEQVLSQADLNDFATAGTDPEQIMVRVRNATPADRAKPRRERGQGPGNNPGNNPRGNGR